MKAAERGAPSIRERLARTLAGWSLAWGLAVGVAVWFAAAHEVDELLDEALRSSGELLAAIVAQADAQAKPALPASRPANDDTPAADRAIPAGAVDEFAWQLVDAEGRVRQRSARAPAAAWHGAGHPGFSDAGDWRLYGVALPSGDMLYAAQTGAERREARLDVGLGAVGAMLAIGLLAHVWLRSRLRAEMQPVQALSERLAGLSFDASGAVVAPALGAAQRRELQPVHDALEALISRLAARVASEQAFAAHAAHALRTPLAGIDAQLAMALRECPPALAERLQRVRGAAHRLQGVVAALLGLFRAGAGPQRGAVDLAALLARLPTSALQVHVDESAWLDADADLLAAALVNLLDNAQRHGARQVWLEQPGPNRLRLRDDGPGIDAPRRAALQRALDEQAYEAGPGLGLVLADRVARAHGGRLALPAVDAGFTVELDLGPADTQAGAA
ncbi:MAG: HAMP domain-containing histidine kinase [Burkholderiales bacterium]|nr:HAMP domain-containing histidine kinase [Burkholderiales bacterium]